MNDSCVCSSIIICKHCYHGVAMGCSRGLLMLLLAALPLVASSKVAKAFGSHLKILHEAQGGVWHQRCYDPDCRSYRSELMPLPPHVVRCACRLLCQVLLCSLIHAAADEHSAALYHQLYSSQVLLYQYSQHPILALLSHSVPEILILAAEHTHRRKALKQHRTTLAAGCLVTRQRMMMWACLHC